MTTKEAERLTELGLELGQRMAQALRDLVPPEAQVHLLNAQRELLTALFLIYEHQVGARRPVPPPRPARRRLAPGERKLPRGRSRVERIPIE